MRPRRHLSVGALASACSFLLLASGCSDLFESANTLQPSLSSLTIDRARLADGGLLYVLGLPTDTSFRLHDADHVPVVVVATTGDSEQLWLRRALCPARERSPYYECYQYDLMMAGGSSATDIAPLVTAAGDRFTFISPSGALANVTVFDPDQTISHARSAQGWPGVAMVLLAQGASGPGGFSSDPRSWLRAPLRVDTGVARPGDGVLQITSGDTVLAEYLQPGGVTLTSSPAVVP